MNKSLVHAKFFQVERKIKKSIQEKPETLESLRSFLCSRNIFEDHKVQNRAIYVKYGNKTGERLSRTSWTKRNNLMLSFKAQINV